MIYDVSYCQAGLKLKDLPKCEGVIIRLGIFDHADTECEKFVKQAIAAKIPYELYWYVSGDKKSIAIQEANKLASLYAYLRHNYKTNCVVWLDIEENNILANFNEIFGIFAEVLTRAGIEYGLYSFLSPFVDKRIDLHSVRLQEVPLWIAWWSPNSDISDLLSKINAPCPYLTYWQQGSTRIRSGKQIFEVDFNKMVLL